VKEPVWVELATLLAIHDEQLAEHGGESGIRDLGLLESALARPRQRHSYGGASLIELAASLAFGISRDHPFIDGNKRTSLVAAELFLDVNGIEFAAMDQDCVETFLALAAGELSEEQLAAWFNTHAR
jgi:death-on-curing protein